MNMDQRGSASLAVKPETYNRLDKMALNRKEHFDSIIKRLLDFWDEKHGITK
jgi:hypothetical protein